MAARLGAPLLALLDGSKTDKEHLGTSAREVKVGARAAGVAIETRFVTDFSPDVVRRHGPDTNGLFVPYHLIVDEDSARRYLEVLSCPLWIIKEEAAPNKIAVLVNDLDKDAGLVHYATILAHRLSQSLRGIINENELRSAVEQDQTVSWIPLSDASQSSITSVLSQMASSLLVMPAVNISLVLATSSNCVVFPTTTV